MKNTLGWFVVAGWLALLAGCVGTKAPPAAPGGGQPPAGEQAGGQQPGTEQPAGQQPGGEQPAGQPQPPAGPQEMAATGIAELGPRPPLSENKAVLALADRAQADNSAGKREAADASLERALRIEPRNPWLWHQLAELRLAQGQYAQAITMARKSNSFAGGKHRVQAENWQVIGQARVAQGDAAGAEQAFKQATDLAKQAQGEH